MTVERTMLFWVAFAAMAVCVSALPLEEKSARVRREVARSLMRETYDFSTTCPGGIILMLGDKQINSQNLRLNQAEAVDVAFLKWIHAVGFYTSSTHNDHPGSHMDAGRGHVAPVNIASSGFHTHMSGEAIAPALYEQPFQDQVDVWCKVAKLTQELAASIGRNINTFDVETLQLYQGDIVLTKNTVDPAVDFDQNPRKQRTLRPTPENPDFELLRRKRSEDHNIVKRKVISDSKYYWTGSDVPWMIDDSYPFSDSDKQSIRNGIAHWEENTCITFPELTQRSRQPHLRFIKGRGCYSYIGKDPTGQPVSIGNGCTTLGIVAHEIGHALGFAHEQSRPDRNRYVRINFSNVWVGFEANFFANNWNFFGTSNIPYDYSSVMHYAARDFARDTTRDTVESVDPAMRETLGQREGLSFWDVRLANSWYCSDQCGGDSLDWDRCQNYGYRNPKNCDECVCPPGWAPPFCVDSIESVSCGSSTSLTADSSIKTLSSPGYLGLGVPPNTTCNYKITAPANMRLRLKFVENFGIADVTTFVRKPSCGSYVEVRHKNMALTGPRFCGTETPRGEFVSHGDAALVTLYNKRDLNRGFALQYSAESCGGCSSGSQDSEPACLRTELYDCDDTSTKDVKPNRCFDVAAENKVYCCEGYALSGDNCRRNTPSSTTSTPTTPTTPTSAPTTAATTTAAPTTAATTTAAPTTAAPTTAATTTAAPTTAAPTTAATTTAAPTTTAKISAAPTTTATSTAAPPPTEAPTEAPTDAPTNTEEPAEQWEPWNKCSGVCGFCGRQGRKTICTTDICDSKVQVRLCTIEGCSLPQPQCYASTSLFVVPKEGPTLRKIIRP